MREKDGLTCSMKAIDRFCLSLDLTEAWITEQVYPYLQDIFKKQINLFNGDAISELINLFFLSNSAFH